jgi:membrane-bound lytic murein transglycosylase A
MGFWIAAGRGGADRVTAGQKGTGRRIARALALGILGTLAACSLTPPKPLPAPVDIRAPGPPSAASAPAAPTAPRWKSRWIGVDWSELPGWGADSPREAWPALLASCARPLPDWGAVCAQARTLAAADDDTLRRFLQANLRAYRIEPAEGGSAEGLVTGYFEPMLTASRIPQGLWRVPLYQPPADLATRKPYWTRRQLDTLPEAQAGLRGRELVHLEDPLDALVLQIQGSGRARVTEPDGRVTTIRLAYAGHNDQPYVSVGRWLIDQGELRPGEASWPAIKDWARRNPARLQEMLWANPRVVFFREEPLPDPAVGPRGAQGVPLTPGRSIAVDPASVPYGTPVWLDTTQPLSSQPLQRLVMAQDTGSAITGAVRADFFWGWGAEAEAQAGRMKQAGRMWALWPAGATQ